MRHVQMPDQEKDTQWSHRFHLTASIPNLPGRWTCPREVRRPEDFIPRKLWADNEGEQVMSAVGDVDIWTRVCTGKLIVTQRSRADSFPFIVEGLGAQMKDGRSGR